MLEYVQIKLNKHYKTATDDVCLHAVCLKYSLSHCLFSSRAAHVNKWLFKTRPTCAKCCLSGFRVRWCPEFK